MELLQDNVVVIVAIVAVVVVGALVLGRGLKVGWKNIFVGVDPKQERDNVEVATRLKATDSEFRNISGTSGTGPTDVKVLTDAEMKNVKVGDIIGKDVSGAGKD